MSLPTDGDYDAMISEAGGRELVQLDLVNTYAIIHAGDAEQSSAGGDQTPGQVVVPCLLVTVRTGVLDGLVPGAAIVIRGAAHVVDRVIRHRNPKLTQFLAYPA